MNRQRSTIKILAPILSLLIGSSCIFDDSSGYRYDRGSLPKTPVNLSDFNSEYDDYNSTAPSLGELIPLCFSTNRNSRGGEFDIIYMPLNVNFNRDSGILKVTNRYTNWEVFRDDYEVIKAGLDRIKTPGNEFGPNLVVEYDIEGYDFTLLYSTDITGNAEINFVTNKMRDGFSEPEPVGFLNSEFDDMYPTLGSGNSVIYFCSNRKGAHFDIYSVPVDTGTDIESLLTGSPTNRVSRDSILSSNSDDTCPFVLGEKMVFASNRPGGYGGYDLYYSNFENGRWGDPVNFGETINSEMDEYRPILVDEGVSPDQAMMLFSSDRPGGAGGFDLYFVGVEY
ncbi:hypothetical protein FK220_013545 [Flavobacteriaceae bacterium TP-CH-4]|uniref:WD40-like Beta Propeller Repeat n=1 Tax=Pelagihabitans pacificus TaxID=2696054 RepID=A0A967AWF1_9FLAO|nr:PD40 domain-containing protein [Pelagihabitans pacificus]NHF60373.1 hypothetical protein [Pelagihabitans pacificus]